MRNGCNPLMPIPLEYILIPLFGLIAFILKGMTGTGTATVIIALCTLILPPKDAIVLSAFINIFGGFASLRLDKTKLHLRYWGPVALMMAIGVIIGGTALKFIDARLFEIILGGVFILIALRFIFGKKNDAAKDENAPEIASLTDMGVGLFTGMSGGFIGLKAPPLIAHFGRYLNKANLRRLLILIFIPTALSQSATYYAYGLLTPQIMLYALSTTPMIFIGLYIGNKAFHMMSEALFKRILGVFLIIVSVKLIL